MSDEKRKWRSDSERRADLKAKVDEIKEMLIPEPRYWIRHPDGRIEETNQVLVWSEWFETADRFIDHTKFSDGSYLSTIFLGLDHDGVYAIMNPERPHKPSLWETMFFRKLEEPRPLPFQKEKPHTCVNAAGNSSAISRTECEACHPRMITHESVFQWNWSSEEDAKLAHKYIATRIRDEGPNVNLDDYDPLHRGEH